MRQQSDVLPKNDDKTIIVFSGDFDKVMAAFVIANGALAMGKHVTMFFTFWGLNAIRKSQPVSVHKKVLEKMFGWMMPRGSKRLKLSQMNMMGMGTKLMRKVMADKNINSLEELIGQARKQGVRILACQMSMDAMGIRREELLDDIEVAGVGTFLAASEKGNMTLFI
ncbi:MAG: DsrE/DsrF/DrsH-like family protein [Megasphaera sp.]|nr:DsrE/DsrF/DrsH-like family protein [Megasphaera sp.]